MPLLAILLIVFGSQFAFAMLQATFSLFGDAVIFADNPDIVELGVGLLLAMVGVGQIVTQVFLIDRLVTRFGEGKLIILGSVLRGLSMILLAIISVPLAAAIALFFFAVGTGTQMPALQSLVTTTVPDNQRGGVLGLYQSAISLSIVVGNAIAGSIFAISPATPFVIGGVLFVIMGIPAFFLMRWSRRQKRKREDEAALQAAPTGD
jgi:MFS family permease